MLSVRTRARSRSPSEPSGSSTIRKVGLPGTVKYPSSRRTRPPPRECSSTLRAGPRTPSGSEPDIPSEASTRRRSESAPGRRASSMCAALTRLRSPVSWKVSSKAGRYWDASCSRKLRYSGRTRYWTRRIPGMLASATARVSTLRASAPSTRTTIWSAPPTRDRTASSTGESDPLPLGRKSLASLRTRSRELATTAIPSTTSMPRVHRERCLTTLAAKDSII